VAWHNPSPKRRGVFYFRSQRAAKGGISNKLTSVDETNPPRMTMAMLATASPGDFVEHAKVLKDLLGAALNTLSA
jgi:hypothetical protein